MRLRIIGLLAAAAVAAAVPAHADEAAPGTAAPDVAASDVAAPVAAPADAAQVAARPVMVTPYGADPVGVPLLRVEPGQHLRAVAPVGHPYKAIVTIPMPEGDRGFRVFVPAGLTAPAPTVVAMPGYGQRFEPESYMRWEQVATARHFVVIYPRGYNMSFNAGRCCGLAALRQVDDDAFLLRVLAVERDLFPPDPRRLYLTGFSNGGMMAYAFACRHAAMVAAIGVVAAAYMAHPGCMPTLPVPVMHIHGRRDTTLPWEGSQFSQALMTAVPSVRQTDLVFGHIDFWNSVPYRNVYLTGVGHVWPHAEGAGHYDATGQLASFLLSFHR